MRGSRGTGYRRTADHGVRRETTLGADHPAFATSLEAYASFLRANHRGAEAEPFEARARAIRSRHRTAGP